MSSSKAQQFFKFASQATEKADAQVMRFIEKRWVSINETDPTGCNVVHYAVVNERAGLVAWLVARAADVNRRDQHGRTPLHIAAGKGHAQMIDILMDNRAAEAVDIQDHDGNTPLHIAAASCELLAVRALLQWGADPSCCNQHGQTPLQLAGTGMQHMQHLGTVRALLNGDTAPDCLSDAGSERSNTSSSVNSTSASAIAAQPLRKILEDASSVGSLHEDPLLLRDRASLASKPENMALTIHLARKLAMAMKQPDLRAPPYLQLKMETVEPLLHSLHRSLTRHTNPQDIEPHLLPVMTTLVDLWHVVERANKPATGFTARLRKRLAGGEGRVAMDLIRLDLRLHKALEAVSAELVANTAAKTVVPRTPSAPDIATTTKAPAPRPAFPTLTPLAATPLEPLLELPTESELVPERSAQSLNIPRHHKWAPADPNPIPNAKPIRRSPNNPAPAPAAAAAPQVPQRRPAWASRTPSSPSSSSSSSFTSSAPPYHTPSAPPPVATVARHRHTPSAASSTSSTPASPKSRTPTVPSSIIFNFNPQRQSSFTTPSRSQSMINPPRPALGSPTKPASPSPKPAPLARTPSVKAPSTPDRPAPSAKSCRDLADNFDAPYKPAAPRRMASFLFAAPLHKCFQPPPSLEYYEAIAQYQD